MRRFLVRGIRREMVGLFSDETAKEVSLWFVANDYRMFGEKVYPYHSGQRGPKWIYPLSDPDLFLSFARLGSGDRLVEDEALIWIREHGLLRRRDPDYSHWTNSHRTNDGEINHQPMTLRDFRSEAVRAHNALTLLKQIRDGDYDALRARIKRDRIYMSNPGSDGSYYRRNERKETATEVLVVDDITTQVRVLADQSPSDDVVHEWAANALEYLVEQKLARLGIIFTQDTRHPRSTSTILGKVPYRPRLTPRCPDLETALWYQFASLIGDKRPLDECSECGETFIGPQRRKTCSPRCRKRRSRRLNRKSE
jgi:hypothetical protein